MNTTATRTKPVHHYVRNAETGHLLRLTRLGEGASRRLVAVMLDEGGAVEIGSVVQVVARTCMAYPAIDAPAHACASFIDGARILDAALEVVPVTVYSVQVRTTTLTPLDPHRIDADTTDTEV